MVHDVNQNTHKEDYTELGHCVHTKGTTPPENLAKSICSANIELQHTWLCLLCVDTREKGIYSRHNGPKSLQKTPTSIFQR